MARISSFRETGERYPFLRVLATICNGFGILLLASAGLLFVAGLGSFLFSSPRPVIERGWFFGAATIWSLGLFAAGIQSCVMGSFLRMAIHIEENTRATAQALDRLHANIEQKPEVDPRSIYLS